MERPNPDEILARLSAAESRRGKLKIFFGAVAGVGKTYTMLEAARARKREGIDVVAGYVETHKRAETEALLEGLEVLPAKIIEYKNIQLREFDVDAALKRSPRLILIDELAHTNAPGSRHVKRLQDVEDILDAGIDVYTTLNVQHCESMNDVVAQVTGVTVRETVPDTFVERADEIELVDIPTEELLKRLKEGKVYLGAQAERAAENFFKPGNLIALRQLALRYTERSVDYKLLSYKQAHSISKVWGTGDRFLVSISPNPGAIRLIRAGKRIAAETGAQWIVANIETPTVIRQEDKDRISEMLRVAENLGARTATLSGQDIAETLILYARSKNISKIIVGKPGKPRLKERIFGSIVDKLARKCGEIDLYLLSGDTQEKPVEAKRSGEATFSWRNLGWTAGIVALCTAVDAILFKYLAIVNLIMVYLLGVAWVAFRYGRRSSIIAAMLSVLFFDFFFVPPYFTFAVADVEYLIAFASMLVVGVTIAHLTGQLKRQTTAMRLREERTQALYALSRDLSKSSYEDELFKTAIKHIEEFFKCRAVIFTPDASNKLAVRFGEAKETALGPDECAVAQWVYEHRKTAGRGTATLGGAKGLYLAFTGLEKVVGVVGVFPEDEGQFEDPDQMHMLEMFAVQTGMAVEGAQLAAMTLDAEAKIKNERFRNLILTTFSYELAEPLTSISQAAMELIKPENIDNKLQRENLAKKIRKEVEDLNELITKLPSLINLEEKKSI